jgi:hypothetical protein
MSDEQKPREDEDVEAHTFGPIAPGKNDEPKAEEDEDDVEAHSFGPIAPGSPTQR